MKKFDIHDLDGHNLRTFLTILQESSVSLAAQRLGVTQSTVSHSLRKLRATLGDPLFVRSGQGLTPTQTALALRGPAQDVLDRMQALTNLRPFDPKSEALHFVVAANDMQRDLVFPQLMQEARAKAIDLSFEIRPSDIPSVGFLRDARCDLILSPVPPDAPDLIQQKLFTGDLKLFYDKATRDPPETLDDYLNADHVAVQFPMGGSSNDIITSTDLPVVPKARVTVANFAGIPQFVLGTEFIATQIEYMRLTSLKSLAMAPLPFRTEAVTIYMIWHERTNSDPAQQWLRDQIRRICYDKRI